MITSRQMRSLYYFFRTLVVIIMKGIATFLKAVGRLFLSEVFWFCLWTLAVIATAVYFMYLVGFGLMNIVLFLCLGFLVWLQGLLFAAMIRDN